jgi:hypothetical protein
MNLIKIFDTEFINVQSFLALLTHFILNTFTLIVIVRYLYYPKTKRKDYLFTYFLIGSLIFLMCYLLVNVQIELGFALGLFAIFGIIRYRTDSIPIKEMTYLFIVIGLSVINALSGTAVVIANLLFTNFAIIAITYGLERIWLLKHESSKIIVYEKINLIKPENSDLLLEDLKNRTGINITRFEIGRIDFLRDTTRIKIYYFETGENAGFSSSSENWKSSEDF